MAIRAHRGTSRAFRKPIRTPECRPDRQKVGKHALATAPDPSRTAMRTRALGGLTPLPLARMPQRTP